MKYKAKPPPGTIADLVMRYRRSPRVLGWAPSTARKFDKTLGRFMAANGRYMVADLRRGDIIAMRDELAATPGEANNWLKVIAGLLDYACDIEMIPWNPARGVKRLKLPGDGFRTWREDEIAAYEAHWPRGSLPRLVFTLALCTGAARSDLVGLGWVNVQGGRIRYRRQKTGAEINLPILPDLQTELSQVPRTQMTFLETAQGTVRSDKALAGAFHGWCEAAGLSGKVGGHHLSLHGLRKAGAVRFVAAGASTYELMAWFGWTDAKSAEPYTRAFDRSKAADAAAGKMGAVKPTNVTRLRRTE